MTHCSANPYFSENRAVPERDIRQWGDPVLRTACDAVTQFDDSIARLCADLLDTVTARDGRAGLAANQIGVGLRAFSWYVDGRAGVIVNPTLVATSGEQDGVEGCLSLPGLWFPLRRSEFAAVIGYDPAGSPISVEGAGLLARALQHECGHLDGQLFIDLLEGDAKKAAQRAARAL
jgi:peptide deformylase